MTRILSIFILLLLGTTGHATHNRAGQLLYRHISGYTYEFTQIHFFYTPSPATIQRIREGLDVNWGDGHVAKIPCVDVEELPDNYTKCVFRMRHTFPGPHTYTILVEDRNRNEGVDNIPGSSGVVFCVKTIFRIDANMGHSTAPELLTYPIDKAAVGRRFVHNPSAYDSEGDSLSYHLVTCLRDRGIEIESYSFPESSNTPVYVDPIKGDFVWDSPVKKGFFNVAMRIDKWRYDTYNRPVKIGSIVRDMQIEVVDSDNRPPEFPELGETCVIAGAKISVPVHVTDPDNDFIELTATGGPFQVITNPAPPPEIVDEGPGYTNAIFTWQTDYSHVRRQPYTVVFKAQDQNTDVKLVSFANYNITVIAPKVENLRIVAEKKEILLEWDRSVCDHASGYEIYRSIGKQELNLKQCDTGIPAGAAYERIATLNGIDHTFYRDNNNVSPGIEYCYRVVAIFADGAKSLPSDEVCSSLPAGTPPMMRAHVATVDVSGEIHVAWLEKPVKNVIDRYMSANPEKTGPFEYRLFHTLDTNADNWTQLGPSKALGDTTYIHERVDTKNVYPYYYKVELWDTGSGEIVDEDSETASTLYPILEPSDKAAIITFGRLTPWVNTIYDIYRCIKTESDICIPTEFVGRTNRETYTDVGLKNGQEYCYLIQSEGYRNIDGVEYDNENRSHVACVTPYDNVPPCAPELMLESICEENRNLLEWDYVFSCEHNKEDDMEMFRIYFSPDPQVYAYALISSENRDIDWPERIRYSYSHYGTLKGCYYVTAVDSAGNESLGSNIECLDICGKAGTEGGYDLPNVFTPNNDGENDIFQAYIPDLCRQNEGVGRCVCEGESEIVTKVDMKIYSRSGKLVFKTEDPCINWDGRDIDSKRFVSPGVYFYICEVHENRLEGPRKVPISGFIHVYTENSRNINN